MEIGIAEILEGSLHDLQDFRRAKSLSPEFRAYAQILWAYLKGDSEFLRHTLDDVLRTNPELTKEMHIIHEAGLLRFQIRNHIVDREHLEIVENLAKSANTPKVWQGELYFIIAMSYEVLGDDASASNLYRLASTLFEECEVKKKAIKSYQNYIAAESRVHHEKGFIVEYKYIFEKAKKLGEFGVAGTALNNISREYEKLGSLKLALKYSGRALVLLKKDFGSLHYYLALAHRAHLLVDLGETKAAKLVIERMRPSTFPEVKAALEVLDDSVRTQKREKVKVLSKAQSALQADQLIRLLMIRPRGSEEIVEILFGNRVDPDEGEQHLKVLLQHIRKKHPSLVIQARGSFQIADPNFLPKGFFKKAV